MVWVLYVSSEYGGCSCQVFHSESVARQEFDSACRAHGAARVLSQADFFAALGCRDGYEVCLHACEFSD